MQAAMLLSSKRLRNNSSNSAQFSALFPDVFLPWQILESRRKMLRQQPWLWWKSESLAFSKPPQPSPHTFCGCVLRYPHSASRVLLPLSERVQFEKQRKPGWVDKCLTPSLCVPYNLMLNPAQFGFCGNQKHQLLQGSAHHCCQSPKHRVTTKHSTSPISRLWCSRSSSCKYKDGVWERLITEHAAKARAGLRRLSS